MKNLLVDIRDFASAAIRVTIFVPMYRAVVYAMRRDVNVPTKIVGCALHGSRNAKNDLGEVYRYFCDYYLRLS